MNFISVTKVSVMVLLCCMQTVLMAQSNSIGNISSINGRTGVNYGDSYIYEVQIINDATSYEWSINGDAVIIDGQGSFKVEIEFPLETNIVEYELKAVAKNDCCVTDTARLNIDLFVIDDFCANTKAVNELSDLTESFENEELCSATCFNNFCTLDGFWSNCAAHQSPWRVMKGNTPSFLTGPSEAASGQKYLYHESSCNDESFLRSPVVSMNSHVAYYIEFWYHMNGVDVGTLELYVEDVKTLNSRVYWSRTGNQGNEWQRARVSLGAYLDDDIFIEFRARNTAGSGDQGDIAIDNISFGIHGDPRPCAIELDLSATPATRFWQRDGSAKALVSGVQSFPQYEWNNGARTAIIDNLNYGVYHVTVTDQFVAHCSAEGRIVVPASGILGSILTSLADLFNYKQDLVAFPTITENKIYPNPTSSTAIVALADAFVGGAYSIVDIATGRTVRQGYLTTNQTPISVVDLATGNYAVVLTKDDLSDVIQIAVMQ